MCADENKVGGGRFKISPVSDSSNPSYLKTENNEKNDESSTDESEDENEVHVYKIIHNNQLDQRNLRPILKKPNPNSSFRCGGTQTDISALHSVPVYIIQ